MRGAISPSTRRPYPLTMVCQTWRLARSSVYLTARPRREAGGLSKRGPRPAVNDGDVLGAIREILQATPFHGEGYRKVRARLAHRGLAVSGKRVLRLMREPGLLAPRRLGPPNGNPAHDGTITTDRPDVMWGTDGTRFYTEREGWCWFFGAIDHHTDELLGWHVAKLGDRWAALEPIRQGVRHAFGEFRKDMARGLRVRCDWGPQYIADAWINEVKWLGITITPSYVGEPQCNGRGGALHAHAQGAMRVPASLREPGAGAHAHRGVHHPVQHRVAHRTSGASHTGSSAYRRPAEGRMSRAGGPPLSNEGRRGSRIDFDEGGRYLDIPRHQPVRAFTTVQRTGCGTSRDTASQMTTML